MELTISNKKWFILFAYRPPKDNNKNSFFEDLTKTLDQAVNKYENIVVSGDLNINTSPINSTCGHLSDFVDTFSLTNLIESKTCFKSVIGTSIDIILTNKPRRFQKTSTVSNYGFK